MSADFAAIRQHLDTCPSSGCSVWQDEVAVLVPYTEALRAVLREWKPPHDIYDPGTAMVSSVHRADCQRCRIDALLSEGERK